METDLTLQTLIMKCSVLQPVKDYIMFSIALIMFTFSILLFSLYLKVQKNLKSSAQWMNCWELLFLGLILAVPPSGVICLTVSA